MSDPNVAVEFFDPIKEVKINNVSELITELNLPEHLLKRLQNLLERIGDEFGGSQECVNTWLNSPNPALGGNPPLLYLQQGNLELIEKLVEMIESGQPR